MKSALLASLCIASLALGACTADTADSSPAGQESAEVTSKSIKKVKKLADAQLDAVGTKLVTSASSFPADGYDAKRLSYTGDGSDLAASLAKYNKHLQGIAELPTAGVASAAQAHQLVDAILVHLELNELDSAEKTAFEAALFAAVWQNGKLTVRVFEASDDENLTHDVFLVDAAHHQILELNEGS